MRSALSLSAFLRCWRPEWPGTELATGAIEAGTLRVAFDPRLKLACHGSRVSSDVGLLGLRERDDAPGLTEMAGPVSTDVWTGKDNHHGLMARVRRSVLSDHVGSAAVNHTDCLGHDPAMRRISRLLGPERLQERRGELDRIERLFGKSG